MAKHSSKKRADLGKGRDRQASLESNTHRPIPSAVLFVNDVPRLSKFYAQVIDMRIVHTDDTSVVLEVENFQLVVHGIPKSIAEQIQISEPPELREETPVKLCLPVDEIAQARTIAKKLGGRVAPKSKEWEARGFRACDGNDPEGNVFQIRESIR